MLENQILQTQICIVGAGPAGVAAALQLAKKGQPCLLLDKAGFPRDKICGDGLSPKVINILQKIDPSLLSKLKASPIQVPASGVRVVAPDANFFELAFTGNADDVPGYVSKRIDFDNFLIEAVKEQPLIDFREHIEISHFQKNEQGWLIANKDNSLQIQTRLLFVANGAHATFTRQVANIQVEPAHYGAAVRAYYSGVTGMHAGNFIELHFQKEMLPGYFWIFPLPNGQANVGLYMLSSDVAKRKVKLRDMMLDIIANHPDIAPRFSHAKALIKPVGYGLPLGSKRRLLSGDSYMLLGDAAYLVDSFTGEGIGPALYSGIIAADQAMNCLSQQDFSAKNMLAYDMRIARVLGQELRFSRWLQNIVRYPWVFNLVTRLAKRNTQLSQLMTAMLTNNQLDKQLTKPMFWLRLLFVWK